jgi:UDP-N-acetylglucosamine 4,6-dehydratase
VTLRDASLIVTGGTGTFAHAFLAHALANGVRRVALFSRDEYKQSVMRRLFPDPRCRWLVGDVRDADRLRWAFRDVDLVVHAAAMKRIESCEENPLEAVNTNVYGTQNVAEAAISARATAACFLSTDKAPAPHTLYGATKMCAERLWLGANVYAAGDGTKLVATRYGNVLGSRGSVLDLWRTEMQQGQPLSITDESMTRFFMTVEAGVALVCLALRDARSGAVYIPKAGSATVLDLARALAEAGGSVYAPGHRVVGLRPGERMHETLISAEESRTCYDAGGHYLLEPEARSWGAEPPLVYPKTPEGYSYRSDSNPHQYTVSELRELIAPCISPD